MTASIAPTSPNEDNAQKHLFLIDGYSFVFRAYHSLPPMSAPDGTPVNAVYGFTNMLMKLRDRLRSDEDHYMLVVFDAGSKTFRNDIYADYKAHRPPAPEDLVPQFPLMPLATQAMNIPSLSLKGYEADDIIATYTKRAKQQSMRVTIVSSDKDLMQLVGNDVDMYDSMKDKRIGPAEVEEKFGVPPEKVLDILSLMGDSADNIPGVPGIGPKIAAELIQTFGSLEGILDNASTIKQKKRRENLIEFAQQARLSYQLAKLEDNTPLDNELEEFHLKSTDKEKLTEFLSHHGFNSLLNRVQKKSSSPSLTDITHHSADIPRTQPQSSVDTNITRISTTAQLQNWLPPLTECRKLALWNYQPQHSPQAILLGKSAGEVAYIPLETKAPTNDSLLPELAQSPQDTSLTFSELQAILTPYLTKDSIVKTGSNLKSLMHLFECDITPADDINVMHYLLGGTHYKGDICALLNGELGTNLNLPKELTGSKATLSALDPKQYEPFFAQLTSALYSLHEQLLQTLFTQRSLTLYHTIDRPLLQTLYDMEREGISVNPLTLKDLSSNFQKEISLLEENIHQKSGKEFNIASPKQLGEVLFEDMKISGGKKTKTGSYKTDVDILEELNHAGHDIAGDILQWRSLSKLKNTYTDALQKEINPATGRIHTTFTTTSTSTARLSSINPNLQNIPVRTQEGRQIRNAFTASGDNVLIGADYSQIELRLLAHIADIDTLKDAFNHQQDIHAITASEVFNVPLEDITPDIRRNAKAINFGIIYGQSAFGLAKQLGISREDAKRYIEQYFHRYPGIRTYMEETKEFAREHGYVTTLFNRKCFIPGIHGKGPAKAFAERAAINAPLQGSAADIIRKAMIEVHRALKDTNGKLLLQVHDELIIEAPKDESEAIQQRIVAIMQNVTELCVPLTVDSNIGHNWNDIH